jgi:hypothetical protein
MKSSGMLRCVALVRTDISQELSAYITRATKIGELGTTLPVTSNLRTRNIPEDAILQTIIFETEDLCHTGKFSVI